MNNEYVGMGGSPNTHEHSVIAFVIDNEIVSVLNTDERLGAILLSNPVVLDISKAQLENPALCEGWRYINNRFIPPITPEEVM
jgi:hypothetical protein